MASSAVDIDQVVPGMLVSNTGVWYRVTHRLNGQWHGVRLGAMDRATAESPDQHPGNCIWPIPKPFLW